jgi:acetyl esterase/lipase
MSNKVTMARCNETRSRSSLALAVSFLCLLWWIAPAPAEEAALAYIARDSFYDPPSEIPSPGTLLRSEPLNGRQIPEGARAWRLLYATTFGNGSPATAVATVLAPDKPATGARPVLMLFHGAAGLAQSCMPSLFTQPYPIAAPLWRKMLDAGWVMVATDFSTAGRADSPHEYYIGEGEARAGFDSVRAARQMRELTLDRERTVVWGYSQGGHAALWAGSVGPRYAPDVNLMGVVALAPAADVRQVMKFMNPAEAAWENWSLTFAYSSFYPDVKLEELIDSRALESVRRVAKLCAVDPAPIYEEIGKFGSSPPLADLTKGALGKRMEENNPTAAIASPLLVAQGLSDSNVPPPVADGYVQGRCAAGQTLDYWLFPGATHQSLVTGPALDRHVMDWTRDRFAGKAQPKGCHARVITLE